MLKDKPFIEEVLPRFIEFAGDDVIMGHNIMFDYSFLKKSAVNNKLTFEKDGIDTLKIARRLLPDVEHRNLEYLCEYFHIDAGSSHRAYDDAVSAKCLYEKLYDIKPDDDIFEKANKLNYTVKRDVPITIAQKNYLLSLVSYYKLELKEPIDQLTKSRASKLIDGIISEYGKMPCELPQTIKVCGFC